MSFELNSDKKSSLLKRIQIKVLILVLVSTSATIALLCLRFWLSSMPVGESKTGIISGDYLGFRLGAFVFADVTGGYEKGPGMKNNISVKSLSFLSTSFASNEHLRFKSARVIKLPPSGLNHDFSERLIFTNPNFWTQKTKFAVGWRQVHIGDKADALTFVYSNDLPVVCGSDKVWAIDRITTDTLGIWEVSSGGTLYSTLKLNNVSYAMTGGFQPYEIFNTKERQYRILQVCNSNTEYVYYLGHSSVPSLLGGFGSNKIQELGGTRLVPVDEGKPFCADVSPNGKFVASLSGYYDLKSYVCHVNIWEIASGTRVASAEITDVPQDGSSPKMFMVDDQKVLVCQGNQVHVVSIAGGVNSKVKSFGWCQESVTLFEVVATQDRIYFLSELSHMQKEEPAVVRDYPLEWLNHQIANSN